jgi:hypothetical protein
MPRHLEELLEAHLVDDLDVVAGARIGGHHPVHVAVDADLVGAERRGDGAGGRVRAAPAQRGELAGAGDALEAGEHGDLAVVERLA